MSTLKVNSIIPVSGVPTGGGGGIIQIKQAVKTDTTSTTSSTQADISGLTPVLRLLVLYVEKLEGVLKLF